MPADKWFNFETMSSLPLNSLRAFALAAAANGVRSAARQLGVSHSSVSRHIAELEAWLGVPLLERTRGLSGMRLTAAGRRLAGSVQVSLIELQAAADAIREARSSFAVTLSTTASFAARWLLPRLPALARAHPRIELSVLIDQRPLDPASSGADFAIRMGEGPWRDGDAEPLMDDRLYPVMNPAFWREAGKPTRVAALAELRLLHDRDPGASWERWRRHAGPANLDLKTGSRLASSDLVLRAAAQGLGVALARDRLVADDLASGVLVRPFGAIEVVIERAYWIVTPAGSPRPAVRTVIGWLRSAAQDGWS